MYRPLGRFPGMVGPSGWLLRPKREPKNEDLGFVFKDSTLGWTTFGGVYPLSMSCRSCRCWMRAAVTDRLAWFFETYVKQNQTK